MNNRPFRRQAYLPQAISHASRVFAPATGFRGLRAVRGRLRLADAFALAVLAWALLADGSVEWPRVALLLGLLRLCRDSGIEWIRARWY